MRLAPWLAVPLFAAVTHAQQPAPDAGVVLAEIRVFNGTEEITSATRLRVVPSGKGGEGAIDVRGATVPLTPAVYDVHAIRTGPGGVLSVKTVDRLSVMHYPDERGRHLEVINFQPGYGALQLRAERGPLKPSDATIFPAGSRSGASPPPIPGDDYLLFVVAAGQYDVRVQHDAHAGGADTHWVLGVDVPPERTRLKLIP